MHYDYVLMPHRKPLRWPNGKCMAVIITTKFEYWDPVKDTDRVIYPGGSGIVGGTLPGQVYDNPNWTWREYGQRVGVWRMFDAFDAAGVPTSCTINAKMALERREVVDHAVSKGYEIVAYNWEQTELLTDFQDDIETKRAVTRKTLVIYREAVGQDAKGWLSCSLRCTPNTVDLIAEEGLIFTCDLLNDDQPYLVQTTSDAPIVSVPYTSEVDDFAVFMRQGQNV
jgi:peptidoglycan/xylan/chitin deacetylase (PgdA/CDA1 family)